MARVERVHGASGASGADDFNSPPRAAAMEVPEVLPSMWVHEACHGLMQGLQGSGCRVLLSNLMGLSMAAA